MPRWMPAWMPSVTISRASPASQLTQNIFTTLSTVGASFSPPFLFFIRPSIHPSIHPSVVIFISDWRRFIYKCYVAGVAPPPILETIPLNCLRRHCQWARLCKFFPVCKTASFNVDVPKRRMGAGGGGGTAEFRWNGRIAHVELPKQNRETQNWLENSFFLKLLEKFAVE